jgi:hypothetical protein
MKVFSPFLRPEREKMRGKKSQTFDWPVAGLSRCSAQSQAEEKIGQFFGRASLGIIRAG